MNAADVVAYTADADIWCPYCAEKRYKDLEHGVDGEGNPIHPCFCGYETDSPDHCAGCGELIEGQTVLGDAVYEAVIGLLYHGDKTENIVKLWLENFPLECKCGKEIHSLESLRVLEKPDEHLYLIHICDESHCDFVKEVR